MKRIYFDHSATTPVDKPVLKAMLPYFTTKFGNASSLHTYGQEGMLAVDQSRATVAKFLNCDPSEIIFTSGATEANNLALFGVIKRLQSMGMNKPHIITSEIEHEAILEPCHELERQGVEVSYAKVKSNGVVDLEHLKSLIKENTVLISVMYVNSEVGAVQPIREIGKIIKKINEHRLNDWNNTKPEKRGLKPQEIYLHTDATQAINFFNCDVAWNYIDLLSFSGHKIYGPKGIGALYVRKGVTLSGIQLGGHHENNKRSGTLNVTGIVGMAAAIAQLQNKNHIKENAKIAKLRDMLVKGVLKNIDHAILNTDIPNATPSHAHFSFLGVEGESILISLDLEGIAVSTGSACAAGSLKPSHVLLAMGIKQEVAHNSIRFTLGKYNTAEEIRRVIKVLPPIIKKFRKFSPLKLV